MSDKFRDSLEGYSGEHPDRWEPKEGQMLVGSLLRYEGPFTTAYGKAHVAVIMCENTGKEYSVWLLETVLLNEFQALTPDPGERIGIKYVGRITPENGSPYKKFIVRVDRQGEAAYNPFKGNQAPPPPAPPAAPARSSSNPFDSGPAGPPSLPVQAATPREDLEASWNRILAKERPEFWGVQALARRDPRLRDDPDHWGDQDYQTACQIYREHGGMVFAAAAKKMGQAEPADAELVRKIQKRLEDDKVQGKLLLQVAAALDTNWHDAVVDAERLLDEQHPKLPWE